MRFILVIFILFYTLSADAQEKFIIVNQKAPNIIAQDIYNRPVNLIELTRTKKILLTFQRYATCPVCNYRIRELMRMHDELDLKGIEVIMFIESSKSNILKNLRGEKMPFYIIADPENKFYQMYGVEKSAIKSLGNYMMNATTRRLIKEGEKYVNPEVEKDGTLKRIEAEFLVNTRGNISMVHYGKYIGDFVQLDKVKSFVVKD